jgi:hypothetical protein
LLKLFILMVAALIACQSGALAIYTSLTNIPSTDVQEEGTAALLLLTQRQRDAGEFANSLGICIGSRGFEWGFDVLDTSGDVLEHIKFNLKETGKGTTGLSIGFTNLSFDRDLAYDQAYLVADRWIGDNRITVGSAVQIGPAATVDKTQLLLGLDRSFSHGWWAAMDYSSGQSGLGGYGLAVEKELAAGRALCLGLFRYNDGSEGDTYWAQYSIDF